MACGDNIFPCAPFFFSVDNIDPKEYIEASEFTFYYALTAERIRVLKYFIPLDKSWMMRMGMLDLLHGKPRINEVLAAQKKLGDDLQALQRCALAWNVDQPLDVGESGTLYRFLQFASWKLHLDKHFILRGTLEKRPITCDPS